MTVRICAQAALAWLRRDTEADILFNEHIGGDGPIVFAHSCETLRLLHTLQILRGIPIALRKTERAAYCQAYRYARKRPRNARLFPLIFSILHSPGRTPTISRKT
jgi:hypothetical protein